jgi:hypothetical protein
MKVIASNIPIHLHGQNYTCDLVLGIYASTRRPALTLVSALVQDFGEAIAVVTTNAPDEYLTSLPLPIFCVKTWSENEGLWEQLVSLETDLDNLPLFSRAVNIRTGTPLSITLGFARSPLYDLRHTALRAFYTLSKELEAGEASDASTLSSGATSRV